MGSEPADHWPLVGRDEYIKGFAQRHRSHSFRGVVILGARGIGTSRLADEFLSLCERSGIPSLRVTGTGDAALIPLTAMAHLLPTGFATTGVGTDEAARAFAEKWPGRRAVLADNAHLLDEESVHTLRCLAGSGAVLLIATVRLGESPEDAAWQTLRAVPGMSEVRLGPLNEAHASRLLEEVLEGPVVPGTAGRLHLMSGGSPYQLRQLVISSLESGSLVRTGGLWHLENLPSLSSPRFSQRAERILGAPGPRRTVIELLSVCGPLPMTELVAAASNDTVSELEAEKVVSVDRQDCETVVSLLDPTLRETVRMALPLLRSRALLRKQAERVRDRAHGSPRDALRLALWDIEATGTASPDILLAAARQASETEDFDGVIRLLSSLAPEDRTVETWLLLGEALGQCSQFDLAERALRQAYEHACDDHTRFRAALECAQCLQMAQRHQEALVLTTEVRAAVTEPEMARTLRVFEGALRVIRAQANVPLELFDDAESIEDSRLRLTAMTYKASYLALLGRCHSALVLAERVEGELAELPPLPLQSRLGSWAPVFTPFPVSMGLAESGDLDAAREAAARGARQCITDRLPHMHTWMSFLQARACWMSGRLHDAKQAYAETFTLARSRFPWAARLSLSGLAASAATMGDPEAAEEALTLAAQYAPSPTFPGEDALGEAWIQVLHGDLPAARTTLAAAAETARAYGKPTSEALLLVDVARLGDPESVVERLTGLSQTIEGPFINTRVNLVRALAGRDAAALLRVSEQLESHGASILAAEAATQAARLWRQESRTQRASYAMERARRLMANCQGAKTPGLIIEAQAAYPLTTREREVALMAAGGASSRTIAERLGLSNRTVDNHLQRAYTKLGVSSRREIRSALEQPQTSANSRQLR